MKKKTQQTVFLEALLSRPMSTNEVMRKVRTTRPPNLATAARDRYHLDLPCTIVSYVDADGLQGTYGVYSLTPEDREKVLKLLSGEG